MLRNPKSFAVSVTKLHSLILKRKRSQDIDNDPQTEPDK
jgi:hypothetical protein